jgi:hypothetical protein
MSVMCLFGIHYWDDWIRSHPLGGTYRAGRECQWCDKRVPEYSKVVAWCLDGDAVRRAIIEKYGQKGKKPEPLHRRAQKAEFALVEIAGCGHTENCVACHELIMDALT